MIILNEFARPENEFITMNLKALSLGEGLGEALGEAFGEAFYG